MTDAEATSLGLFDRYATAYEAWFDTPLGRFVGRRERDMLLGLLRPRQGERLLEVGSGTGYFLREVARSGARCVGLEPSPEMLRVAAARALPNVDYARGMAQALPFRPGAFDGLLMMTTLEFLPDPEAAVREAARVVRSGGRLVFGVLNAEGPWADARRRTGGLWDHARLYSAAELRDLLAPFGSLTLRYCVHVPPRLGGRLPGPLLPAADGLARFLAPSQGALIGVRVDVP